MDRNRKILISILALLLFSIIISVVDIGLTMQKREGGKKGFSLPPMGPGVGIVRIEGPIGMAGRDSGFGIKMGAERIIERLDRFENDSDIKAVIIRINSPGGTVAATQEIYEKIWKLRKKSIPLVASMGDIAASGGYYIASACNYIIANHGTITGSIGVIAFSPNLKRLFDKFGIKMNVIKSGKYKDILSSHRDLSQGERDLLQEMIDSSYRRFLKDIAKGRNLNQSEIEPYADGRIMNGEKALKVKLIDFIGTFEDAIDKARELAKLPENSSIYDDKRGPVEQLLMSIKAIISGKDLLSSSFGNDSIYRFEYRYMP